MNALLEKPSITYIGLFFKFRDIPSTKQVFFLLQSIGKFQGYFDPPTPLPTYFMDGS